jgi:outer membrane receptor protein involved in Fe transport
MYIPGSLYNNEPFPIWPGAPKSRLGGQDETIGRITLTYNPNSHFDATLKVTGDLYSDDGPSLEEEVNCGPNGVPTTATVFSSVVVVDPFQGCSNRAGVVTVGGVPLEIWMNEPEGAKKHDGNPYSDNDSLLTTLAMRYKTDTLTISSNTGYYYYDYDRYDAFNAATFSSNDAWQNEVQNTFSEEVRAFSTFNFPLNFMVGAYYDNTTRTDANFGKITLTALRTDANGVVHAEDWDGLAHVHEATYSVFGQLIWKIVPALELAGGARYTYVDQSADQQNTYVNPLLEYLFGNPALRFLKGTVAENPANLLLSAEKGNNISPEITLTWTPTPEFTLYGGYKTGYKAGGFSTNTVIVASATGQTLTFGPESSNGFEFGAKTTLFGGRVRGDLTFYRYDFNDLQVNSFNPVTISFTIQNAAAARTEGVELNADWAATNELRFTGGFGYNDAKYISFPNASCYAGQTPAEGCTNGTQSLAGQPLTLAPKVSANVGFSYERPIATHWRIGLSSELRYNSSFAGGIPDEPNSTVPAQTFVDASVRVSTDDDRYEVALIGRDLANVIPLYGIGDKPSAVAGELVGQAAQGRYVTLEFTYHY